MSLSLSTTLSDIETARLAALESTVEKGKQTFIEVGNALGEIRDARLYRTVGDTFEKYCQKRFGFSRRYANQLIEASEVVTEVATDFGNNCSQFSPQTENSNEQKQPEPTPEKTPLPENEGQARALADAPKGKRAKVWKEAVDSAPKDEKGKPKVTAKHVAKVVKKNKPAKPTEPSIPNIAPEAAPVPEIALDPWESVAADVDGIISDLRGVTIRMRTVFIVQGQEITRTEAKRYTWSQTVGAVNAVMRDLEQNKPIGIDDKGIVTIRDIQRAKALDNTKHRRAS